MRHKASGDWLLDAARLVLLVIQIVLLVAALAIGFALVMITIDPAELAQELARTDSTLAPASFYWVVAFGLVGVLALLAMGVAFLQTLSRIIATVAEDPFTPANADRLRTMAWLLLAIQVGATLLAIYSEHVARYAEALSFGEGSLTGLLAVLVLFILSRVFRQGAALRADLEGTV